MHNEKVVSNTTPIITLSEIECLWLLEELYRKIFIPQAVYDEIIVKKDNISAELQSSLDWIMVETVKNAEMRRLFASSLHSGEVEALILASEINADIIIIDDLLARKYAIQAGMNLTGTMGVLLKAKKKGLVNQMKPLLDDMVRHGIYLNK